MSDELTYEDIRRIHINALRQAADLIPHTLDPNGWVARWLRDTAEVMEPIPPRGGDS